MDAVEDIKARLPIEDVVGEYVELKRAGRNYKGLSPFSAEKTPSFMVSPDKGIWHDFSSGKGGSMFGFVMEMEGVDFRGALEILAKKAGLDLDQYNSGRTDKYRKDKDTLLAMHDLAAKYYQVAFSRATTALEYFFKKRRFTKETALDFKIGYAPGTGRALTDFLKKKGYSQDLMVRAGLAAQTKWGVRDMFRDRLMVPLADQHGSVIGFTGRLLADIENAPKYLNTPQTLLYDKSGHVYGLHLAKDAIRKCGYVVAVEGNLDVVAAHQAGTKQVVATAGTAMTEQHLKVLGRFTDDIRLCFDADKAGIAATERIIPLAESLKITIRVVHIEGAKDPDELIQKDPEAWQKAIENPMDVMDWLIMRHAAIHDLETQAGREDFKKALFGAIRSLKSPGEKGIYLKKVAKMLGYAPNALAAELKASADKSAKPEQAAKKRATPKAPQSTEPEPVLQDHMLALILHRPAIRNELEGIFVEIFSGEHRRALYKQLMEDQLVTVESIATTDLQDMIDYVKILSLEYEELYAALDDTEAHYEVVRLRAKVVEDYVKRQKSLLARAMQSAKNDDTVKELLGKVIKLDQLLRDKGVLP
jgi:DNA primase